MLRGREGIQLKESASPPVTPAPHSASSTVRSGTKREPVSLPSFMGAEKPGNTPFQDFPVWLKNWQDHIVDYEAKSRSNLLLNHLDKDALRKIAGVENDYDGAMKKLQKYFGDQTKVIRTAWLWS